MTDHRQRALVTLMLCATLLLAGCSEDLPAIQCGTPDFDCYINQGVRNVNVLKANTGYWSTINLVCQVVIVVLGIIATVVIAVGDMTRRSIRVVAIAATALVTGISSGASNLHVAENVDKLIDLTEQLGGAINDLDEKAELLKDGRTPAQVAEAYRTDAEFRRSANQVTTEYANRSNHIKAELWRIKGTAARLNPPPIPKAPASAPRLER